jgi:hypothetical protein
LYAACGPAPFLRFVLPIVVVFGGCHCTKRNEQSKRKDGNHDEHYNSSSIPPFCWCMRSRLHGAALCKSSGTNLLLLLLLQGEHEQKKRIAKARNCEHTGLPGTHRPAFPSVPSFCSSLCVGLLTEGSSFLSPGRPPGAPPPGAPPGPPGTLPMLTDCAKVCARKGPRVLCVRRGQSKPRKTNGLQARCESASQPKRRPHSRSSRGREGQGRKGGQGEEARGKRIERSAAPRALWPVLPVCACLSVQVSLLRACCRGGGPAAAATDPAPSCCDAENNWTGSERRVSSAGVLMVRAVRCALLFSVAS